MNNELKQDTVINCLLHGFVIVLAEAFMWHLGPHFPYFEFPTTPCYGID